MTDGEFRRRAMDDIARLLTHWRTVEFWIKRAEQVNGKAVIPAINELRYASRQLFNAIRILGKDLLTEGDRSAFSRRVIIAEQYLYNSEHDICDSIVGFYEEIVSELDDEFGQSTITIEFPEYPLLKKNIKESFDLIADARFDYDKRAENYKALRENHFPHLIASYDSLVSAEVAARANKAETNRQLRIASSKITLLSWVGLIGAFASIISIPLAVYLWTLAYDDFCNLHGSRTLFRLICG